MMHYIPGEGVTGGGVVGTESKRASIKLANQHVKQKKCMCVLEVASNSHNSLPQIYVSSCCVNN